MGWTYGIQLPIQTLSQTTADPWEHEASVADLIRVARHAEATGHDFIGVCDHVAIPDNEYATRMSTTWYDTIATLGFLAACTSRTRLLSVVWVAAYRHPLQTAKAFATLDHLSSGRMILGVGAGHLEDEFNALGVPFKGRGALLDETLDAVRAAFREQHSSFDGEHFRYERMAVAPRPVNGDIPIWVGGAGPAAWQRAGRIGDGYIPMAAPVSDYDGIIDAIRTASVAAGRAENAVAIGFMPPPAHLTGPVAAGVGPVELDRPERLVHLLRTAREGGADVMHVRFRAATLEDYLEQLDAFAELVVPHVD